MRVERRNGIVLCFAFVFGAAGRSALRSAKRPTAPVILTACSEVGAIFAPCLTRSKMAMSYQRISDLELGRSQAWEDE